MSIVKRVDNPYIDPKSLAKVTYMGNVVKVLQFNRFPHGCPIQNLDKEHYIDLRTGEYCDKQSIANRAESTEGIRRTMEHIRALVNTNVVNPDFCRWVTLTYAHNVTDTKVLYSDFDNFRRKLYRFCEKYGYGKPEYISVIEPQGRGAWHVHAFFIWDKPVPFIPNDARTRRSAGVPDVSMASLWGHGFTKTQRIADVDNIGAYFSAYLGDIPLDELPSGVVVDPSKVVEKDFTAAKGTLKRKKFVKGGRLSLYPPGMNIIRHSKGIKYPVSELMSQKKAKEKVKAATLTFSSGFEIYSDVAGDGPLNALRIEYYNTHRKKRQDD